MLERSPATGEVCIEMNGDPRGKGRPRSRIAGNPRSGKQWVQVYTDPETRKYEDRLKSAAALAMHGHDIMTGPLQVKVIARFGVPASWSNRKRDAAIVGTIRPTGKPDWDNIGKIVDAFNGIVWNDDAQIVEGTIIKLYGNEPAITVTVRQLAPQSDQFSGGEQ